MNFNYAHWPKLASSSQILLCYLLSPGMSQRQVPYLRTPISVVSVK